MIFWAYMHSLSLYRLHGVGNIRTLRLTQCQICASCAWESGFSFWGELFSHNFITYIFYPFSLPSPSETLPVMWILACLMSYRSFKVASVSKICFPFCCFHWAISIILSSRSLIHSSALFSLPMARTVGAGLCSACHSAAAALSSKPLKLPLCPGWSPSHWRGFPEWGNISSLTAPSQGHMSHPSYIFLLSYPAIFPTALVVWDLPAFSRYSVRTVPHVDCFRCICGRRRLPYPSGPSSWPLPTLAVWGAEESNNGACSAQLCPHQG